FDSSSGIRRLRLVCCYGISDEGLIEVASKLPLLEDLEISFSFASAESLDVIGRSCPLLKSLKLNKYGYTYPYHECEADALAIASTMPDLRHLQLCGNKLTNDGLQKILDCCLKLESLDVRKCFNINFGVVLKRCSKRIKSLRLPDDSTDDYEFDRANRRELYAETQCDPDFGDFLLFGRSVFGRDW
ncbi:putative F-box/LRR-repeat protein 23, partial [Argentina anserina]|uniref:putative F-box/LRR-repeat protein 23 n=1 Tax=Argentina anserina TaxID=57926 RepID=UPI0021766F93